MIGKQHSHLIFDFAFFGRMPLDSKLLPCYRPDVPLPDGSPGCLVYTSESILRYWCQGKETCFPSATFIAAYDPEACAGVTAALRIRYRTESDVSQCAFNSSWYAPHNTCYLTTDASGRWEDQLLLCRQLGGDMMHLVDNDADFATWALTQAEADVHGLWLAGNATEPRPVLDLRREWYLPNRDRCLLPGGAMAQCQGELRTLCALPPWPKGEVPASLHPCPAASFPDYGLSFPVTAAGRTAVLPCGATFKGSATYTCGLDGRWSAPYPDLTQCTSSTIDTDDVANRLKEGNQSVSLIVQELATNCSRTTLSSGDVIGSVQLLPLMVETQRTQLRNASDHVDVADGYVRNVTYLVSQLTKGDASWFSMPPRKRRGTSTLLQYNVEQSAYLLAGYLQNEGKNFTDHSEIRLRAGRFTNDTLASQLQYRTRQGSSVTLPAEVARFQDEEQRTSLVFVEYGNMDCLLRGQKCSLTDGDYPYSSFVNSPLISASASGERFIGNTSVMFETSNVTLHFATRLSAREYSISNVQCAFWNDSVQDWSTEGCYVSQVSDDFIECSCNHLTSFATLMDINGVIVPGSGLDLALSWLTNVGCVISLICLALCIVIFSAVSALRSDRTSVHRNLCLCLFAAELILLAGLEPHGNAVGCAIVAGLLHFFFLAAFAWMCIEGVQIYLLLYKVFDSGRSYMRYFYGLGYGVPALIVTISVASTKGVGYGTDMACWLSTENGLIWAFAGPLLLVILVNILVLVLALRVTARATAARSNKDTRQVSTWIKGSASLVAILGTTWLFGFLYFSNGLLFFSVVFALLNSLQGFFIFLFHVVLNEKNRTEATRFMWKTTRRAGLSRRDPRIATGATTTGRTSREPVTGETTDGDSDHQSSVKQKTRLTRLLQRAGNKKYSVRRIDDESLSSGMTSQDKLRRVESNGVSA
ncbi:adhesion G protein-coupled receptor L4-like [Pollicipes pollicipes]|uniref:adhesion G protein-coupled receptor L4-like n=1 Tax=Pollicipes pollicipes TaxID=41117 RepID=UPI0018858072|nr:adhesion G protein-coupled receptor L4-like [Pollicipes pollicipes]